MSGWLALRRVHGAAAAVAKGERFLVALVERQRRHPRRSRLGRRRARPGIGARRASGPTPGEAPSIGRLGPGTSSTQCAQIASLWAAKVMFVTRASSGQFTTMGTTVNNGAQR